MTGWRYTAVDPRTGTVLHPELPLSDVMLTRNLSGPWELTGTLVTEDPTLLGGARPVLSEWGTAVWADLDGRIRGGGIVTSLVPEEQTLALGCEGYARYPVGVPYLGRWSPKTVDPLVAFRHIYSHVQSYSDGQFGMTIDPTTSGVRVGSAEQPYDLAWWNLTDCGDELRTLATETPFDYLEEHEWIGDSDAIRHHLRVGYPQLGRRRDDLVFAEGENLLRAPTAERDAEGFAQYVFGVGARDQTTQMPVASVTVGQGDHRLRRVSVYDRPDIAVRDRLSRLAQARQKWTARPPGDIREVAVMDHDNARLGSWDLGDEVAVSTRTGWGAERVTQWCRIVSEKVAPARADEFAILTLAPVS